MGPFSLMVTGTVAGPATRGTPWPATVPVASVRLGVGLGDLGRDAAAVGDGEAVLPRPLADLRGVAGGTPARAAGGAARGGGPAAAGAAGVPHPGRQRVTQLGRVLGGEVDLVVHAVEAEQDGLVRECAVDVVDQRDLNLLRHVFLSSGLSTRRFGGAHSHCFTMK